MSQQFIQQSLFSFEDQSEDWLEVRDRGGLFFCSHSAGKDSQAMYLFLKYNLNIPSEQIIVVHAHLGEIEWDSVKDHITDTVDEELHVVQAVDKHGTKKDFISMVEARGMWPAPKYRQCTSDLKKGPIYKFIRRVMKDRGVTLGVNCTGMRAEESPARKRRPKWSVNTELSKAGREVYEYLPIHDWTTDMVFDRIEEAGQKPHPAYGERGAEGNTRLSCVFCIMGSVNDHRNGAKARPELYKRLVEMEIEMDHTMFKGVTLEQRNGLTVEEAFAG